MHLSPRKGKIMAAPLLTFAIQSNALAKLLADLDRRAREADAIGASAPVSHMCRQLSDELREADDGDPAEGEMPTPAATWRERLWTCPPQTRLNVSDLAEAMARPKSWMYRQTSAGCVPSHKLDGALVFVAGEVREWLNRQEEPVALRA